MPFPVTRTGHRSVRRAPADSEAAAAAAAARAPAADAADDRRFRKAVEMSTASRSVNAGRFMHGGLALACAFALVAMSTFAARTAAQSTQHRTYASPEEAVKALIETVKAGNLDQLVAIFGPEGKELIASSDPATARQNRQVFTVAAGEQWRLEDTAANRKTLVIGNEEWPFPVPLVKEASGWRFDTAAGKEEVIARRIGRNELSAIDTVRAYVTAQRRYAEQGHDGKPAGLYATKFRSDPGKQDGLYWPVTKGQQRSPLGDLLAEASEERRAAGGDREQPAPFHGYYFKILTAQGAAAAGGARSYIVKGDMSGGFALVAWPAQYDVTGVMTFLVSHDGIVHEKDLGQGTDAAARKMTAYNPDSSWRQVQ
jgi:hypothetical protein